MKIRDYLHHYIGKTRYRNRYVDYLPGEWTVWSELTPERYARLMEDFSVTEIQIEARPLSSMTEEEAIELTGANWKGHKDFEIYKIEKDEHHIWFSFRWPDERYPSGYYYSSGSIYFNKCEWKPKQFHYLLSRHFDVFGLIEKGMAIDSTQSLTTKEGGKV